MREQDQQVSLLSLDMGQRVFDPYAPVDIRLRVKRAQVDGSLKILRIGLLEESFTIREVKDLVLASRVEILRRFLD